PRGGGPVVRATEAAGQATTTPTATAWRPWRRPRSTTGAAPASTTTAAERRADAESRAKARVTAIPMWRRRRRPSAMSAKNEWAHRARGTLTHTRYIGVTGVWKAGSP